MASRMLFLKWWLFACILLFAGSVVYVIGGYRSIYAMDASKLSFLIIAIFVVMTGWCGRLSWKLDQLVRVKEHYPIEFLDGLRTLENQAEHGWYAVALCEKIGLLGTVWGFIMILIGGFSNLQQSDQQMITKLLEQLSAGMSTAFVTTLVGIICSILLSLQYHLLSNALGWLSDKAPSKE